MSEENNPTPASSLNGQGDEKATPTFAIRRIYLKDLSFETPMGIEGLSNASKAPNIEQELNVQTNTISETLYEVALLLTITAKLDDKAVFLIEVKQAGLFEISNMPKDNFGRLINAECPTILFPYAREAIDNTLNRGGFAPLNMPPINFDAVFAQAISSAQQKQQAESPADA
ncbi:protein-export chaperone SecB [Gilvimarinus agarilyticus]|uniref:protein-export chaperone SecB n=1 Tax=unclassified Gilvimarinus TaxID=2642066 RepID=UPI001C084378|nr:MULTISPECIES: protein-export chaperone SecB [unclassified Gilvimarinus]MBU2885805.1 protein-export chaperone SecB [Gilvimarinus agarilyticus]MDO6570659.1 protein-export chaperone SecB [Gilvimarinus sp. 2_MG-2023]MDO6746676.1 protein-export chaperone SecB [Gilvimarinus sp. 1_MG-2023]